MAILAWVLGIVGGLCAAMGIVTAAEVDTLLGAEFSAIFWLALAAVLLLGCIATVVSRSSYE